ARFAVPASQCPTIAPEWEDPRGVPISAILFGGRRASAVPLVTESLSWQHGVFMGANVASEKTAAAEGKVGELRRDPFAMLPFCGYNMGDYMAHWIKVGQNADPEKLPKIYYVNWFRKDDGGRFVWPGFGENSRVLKWIVGRLNGDAEGVTSPIGVLPAKGALDTEGLDLSEADLDFLLTVDKEVWREEAALVPEHLNTFGDHTPKELWEEYRALVERLG
ncbi:phosphoenolpyruvate carboxykinase domain-containing protein, partial [Streptomyces otsuchiensis]